MSKGRKFVHKTHVPHHLLRPYVQKHLEERKMGEAYQTTGETSHASGSSSTYSAAEALAFNCGLTKRTILDVVKKEGYVTLATADKIINVGLDEPYLWYTDPELNKFYTNV